MKRREESRRRAEAARGLGLLTVPTDVASQGLGSGQAHRSTPPTSSPSSLGVTRIKIHPEKKYKKKYPEGCIDVRGSVSRVVSKCRPASVKAMATVTAQENEVPEDNHGRV